MYLAVHLSHHHCFNKRINHIKEEIHAYPEEPSHQWPNIYATVFVRGNPLWSLWTFELETLCLSHIVPQHSVTSCDIWTYPFLLSFFLISSPILSFLLLFIWHIFDWHLFNWQLIVPYMLVHILDYASRVILILFSSDPLLGMLYILVHCCEIEHLRILC